MVAVPSEGGVIDPLRQQVARAEEAGRHSRSAAAERLNRPRLRVEHRPAGLSFLLPADRGISRFQACQAALHRTASSGHSTERAYARG